MNKLESISHIPDLNILSQSLRIAGSAGNAIYSIISDGGSIVSSAAKAIGEIAPVLRLPFHLIHAGAKAIETKKEIKSGQSWASTLLGSTFSALNALRIILVESEEILPLLENEANHYLSKVTSLIGTAIPYVRAAEMGCAIHKLILDRPDREKFETEDWVKLSSYIIELTISLAITDASVLSHETKELTCALTGIVLGSLAIWSTLLKESQHLSQDEKNSDIFEV
jgi:hypothetical protein